MPHVPSCTYVPAPPEGVAAMLARGRRWSYPCQSEPRVHLPTRGFGKSAEVSRPAAGGRLAGRSAPDTTIRKGCSALETNKLQTIVLVCLQVPGQNLVLHWREVRLPEGGLMRLLLAFLYSAQLSSNPPASNPLRSRSSSGKSSKVVSAKTFGRSQLESFMKPWVPSLPCQRALRGISASLSKA